MRQKIGHYIFGSAVDNDDAMNFPTPSTVGNTVNMNDTPLAQRIANPARESLGISTFGQRALFLDNFFNSSNLN